MCHNPRDVTHLIQYFIHFHAAVAVIAPRPAQTEQAFQCPRSVSRQTERERESRKQRGGGGETETDPSLGTEEEDGGRRERETRVKFCWSRAAADQQNHGEEPPFVFPWLQWRGGGYS